MNNTKDKLHLYWIAGFFFDKDTFLVRITKSKIPKIRFFVFLDVKVGQYYKDKLLIN